MRALFQITEKGRAADGRRLAARATLVQLAVVWGLFTIIGTLEISAGNEIAPYSQTVVVACVFYVFFLYALARDWAVAGILYGGYLLLGFFVGSNLIGLGLLYALGTIVSSILNFVALCGIVIWLRNRSATSTNIV
ncbi:hypothetical protein MACH17_32590 [Phaeobacter inhibens]|uniref:hypothetical protein n=1 Tax=Phaeobacter inhibens TaxID=221822 RepID=UPI00275D1CF6|nr:hypothetical protein [Phaeobacter inhibens]GLO71742.1 hypothetical protein MACH17_32590 [Phaeobacter inhibens]